MWFQKRIYLLIKKNYGFCLISLFLALLFLVNRNLFIINPYWLTIDPWLYTGYFLNFEGYYRTFGVLYYGTRLSWIIPGYTLYKIFPILVANYILHFGFIAAAVLSLYYILKRTISERTAVFTTLLFAGYVYFLNEMGWDYISCPAITFFLLAILFIVLSTQSRYWRYHLFIAGMFCISMLYANLFMIVFLPTLTAFLLFIYPDRIKKLTYFIPGVLVGSIIMELFVYLLTGNIWVIFKQVNIARHYYDVSNPWLIPVWNWILNAQWLLLPLIVVIGCIIFLLFQCSNTGNKNKYSYNLLFVLNFLATILIFMGFHIKGDPVFQFTYYACYLIPPMFLALGAICSGILDSLTSRQVYSILCIEICLLLLPYTSINTFLKLGVMQSGIYQFFWVFAVCWIILLSLSTLSQKIQIKSLSIPILLLAIVLMCLFNGITYPSYPTNHPDTYENGFASIIGSVRTINDETNGQYIKFWYDVNESGKNGYYGGLFNNINAMNCWGYTWVGRDFPDIDKKNVEALLKQQPKPNIVILSTKNNVISLAEKSLGEIGYNVIPLSERNVNVGKVNFNITLITITPVQESLENISVNQFTPHMLMNLISKEYPEIGKENITDFEKVNILRSWAYEHTDLGGKIHLDSEPGFYQKKAPELYYYSLTDTGGVTACSGVAVALNQLYVMYGYNSSYMAIGDPTASHALNLVQINQSGKIVYTVQDAYFDYTFVDKKNNPIDYFDMLNLLRVDQYSDIVIKYGTKKPSDLIFNKSLVDYIVWLRKHDANYQWIIVQDDNMTLLSNGLYKIKIQRDLIRSDNSMRNYYNANNLSTTSNPIYNTTYPSLNLFKYPFSIGGPESELMEKAKEANK